MQVTDEDRCWQAVLARDADADGRFVYAVRSTGVYCRPACPSPRPRRDGVTFFPVPEAAAQAGYRPCRRCRPEEVAAPTPQVELVRRVCRHIEANLDAPLTLDALGDALGRSGAHLQRTFKRLTGITPRQYADACRLNKLKATLKDRRTVTMAIYEAGYGSSSRLYERAADQLGMTPATYRRGGRGATIRYTIAASPLGRLLLAGTDCGVCAVCIDDDDAFLQEVLREEFPAANVVRDDAALAAWTAAVLEHLRGQRPHLQLPLDVQATAFQWRVWQELCKIPLGETRTYTQVAAALGQPTAARAVARACATNPVAVIVPCHRVIREDGDLAGYRWGIERKQALLDAEKADGE